MGSYVPSTRSEREEMLKKIGCSSINELFSSIPKDMILNGKLNIPSGLSEMEVSAKMKNIAGMNTVFPSVFRGAGAYKHYIPSIVKYVSSKEEFVTAYTPYQAEISQGILQSIFEYQTNMCELTGMDVSNASVYDGATAAAEAVAMCRERKRTKALVAQTAHPDTINVIKTYCEGANAEMVIVPSKDGVTDIDALKAMLTDDVACLFVQQPNFFGQLEPCSELGEAVHENGGKYIIGTNPIALGVIKTPREYGADVATMEGQPLGMPLSFGGPYLGVMTCTEKMMRKIPGRIVGQTVDKNGKRCFVLTLQAREQHIRREKASSNICSNQALCALTSSVYLAALGQKGLVDVAEQCVSKAHYFAKELQKLEGFELKYKGEFFHEFVIKSNVDTKKIEAKLSEKGILSGLPLSSSEMLWCVTEMNTKNDMDNVVNALKEVSL